MNPGTHFRVDVLRDVVRVIPVSLLGMPEGECFGRHSFRCGLGGGFEFCGGHFNRLLAVACLWSQVRTAE